MRKLQIYVDKYGPDAGRKLYHALQSQAAHAGVSARLRRKLQALTHGEPWPPVKPREETLPLFPEREEQAGNQDVDSMLEASCV